MDYQAPPHTVEVRYAEIKQHTPIEFLEFHKKYVESFDPLIAKLLELSQKVDKKTARKINLHILNLYWIKRKLEMYGRKQAADYPVYGD